MKRWISLLLVCALALSLTACGSTSSDTGIDVDLTKMSSTMVYSEVFNMLYTPEDYLGKTINMDGSLAIYHDETQGRYYYACIIQDATACCSQGIEFVLSESLSPEEYPPEGSYITVRGVFDVYEEDGFRFCQLINADMT